VVAKIFHGGLTALSEKLDKVAAMVDHPPSGAVQSDGFVVLTWPEEIVSKAGRPVGYVMRRIDTAMSVEIHTISNPFHRTNPLPGAAQWTANATWAHLVSVAANLCLAMQVVHAVNAVIGDFQERNILVSDTTRVTLVDCDSMQFTAPTGRQFLCGVARPEYTAPELAKMNLRTDARGKPSDLFALAVHIYQLLMGGNHPFMRGVWEGPGEQPPALELAKSGWWAGGPGSLLSSHPLTPPLSFLPTAVESLFVRAFTEGARNPGIRPTADEWRRALLNIKTTTCRRGGHHIPVAASSCPWCAIDAERGRRKKQSEASRVELQSISQIPHTHTPTPRNKARTAALPKPTSPKASSKPASTAKPPTAVSRGISTPNYPKPKKPPPKPVDFGEEIGRNLYTLFKIVGIPVAVAVAIVVICIFIYAIDTAMRRDDSRDRVPSGFESASISYSPNK
jgi:DNA-binding helix-hairpin-helix protein with protein kinase domain